MLWTTPTITHRIVIYINNQQHSLLSNHHDQCLCTKNKNNNAWAKTIKRAPNIQLNGHRQQTNLKLHINKGGTHQMQLTDVCVHMLWIWSMPLNVYDPFWIYWNWIFIIRLARSRKFFFVIWNNFHKTSWNKLILLLDCTVR